MGSVRLMGLMGIITLPNLHINPIDPINPLYLNQEILLKKAILFTLNS